MASGWGRGHSADKLTHDITGLSELQEVAVAVLVKDEAGKTAIYPPQKFKTLDATAPTVGEISITDVAFTELTVNWTAASAASGDHLEYKLVVASATSDIDTLDEADGVASESVMLDWSVDTLTKTVSDLEAGTTYAFAVLVRDSSGNKALYTSKSATTENYKVIFAASASLADGDIKGDDFNNGIEGADDICMSDANKPASGTFKAIIVDGVNRIACTTANCSGSNEGVDWVLKPNTTYVNGLGQVIGTTNDKAIFTSIQNDISPGGLYWTGLNPDWTSSDDDCLDWTSNNGDTDKGMIGAPSMGLEKVFSSSAQTCMTSQHLYCAEQ